MKRRKKAKGAAKAIKRPKNKKMTAVLTRTSGTLNPGVVVKEARWSIEPDKTNVEKQAEQMRQKESAYWHSAEGRAMQLRLDVAMVVLRGLKARGWQPRVLAKRIGWRLVDIHGVMRGDFILDTDGIGALLHALDARVAVKVQYSCM